MKCCITVFIRIMTGFLSAKMLLFTFFLLSIAVFYGFDLLFCVPVSYLERVPSLQIFLSLLPSFVLFVLWIVVFWWRMHAMSCYSLISICFLISLLFHSFSLLPCPQGVPHFSVMLPQRYSPWFSKGPTVIPSVFRSSPWLGPLAFLLHLLSGVDFI